MLEVFWLPRREGGRGTEITTLPGGQNLGELTDVKYFQQKLYRALNVPESRLQVETSYNVGRSTEIQRDEVKFEKFVNRIRMRFSQLFIKSLEKQLILKGLMSSEEWKAIEQDIKFEYAKDNYFAELKEIEIQRERISLVRDMDDFAGRYYSHEWIRRNILRQNDDDIELNDNQIAAEADDPQFAPPPEADAPQAPLPSETQQ